MHQVSQTSRAQRTSVLFLGLALGLFGASTLPSCCWSGAERRLHEPQADAFRDHVAILASDEMGGRDTGTAGNTAAVEYVVQAFSLLGLEPAGDDGTYLQEFPVTVGRYPVAGCAIDLGGNTKLKLGADFVPSEFSADGRAQGPLLLLARDVASADDFGGVDVAGKIVLMHATDPRPAKLPGGANETDRRDLADPDSAAFVTRLETAFARGAAGLLVIGAEDSLPTYRERSPFQLSIPAATLSKDAGRLAVEAAERGAAARITVKTHAITIDVANVLGRLPPAEGDPQAPDIVLGAHIDHIGLGGDSRSRGIAGQVHNGADDNASGIAALLEIARIARGQPLEHTGVVFVAFNGEELGLLGSQHFVKANASRVDDIVAMLNFDMVGRAQRDADADHEQAWRYLAIGGVGSSPSFDELARDANDDLGAPFELDSTTGIFNGSSDHIPFYTAGVPVLFFFTGLHNEYHAHGDDVELIDADGGAQIAALAWDLCRRIDAMPLRPAFVRAEEPPTSGHDISSPGRRVDPRTGSAYGVYLGTIPDFAAGSADQPGVVLSGVQPGSPAEAAGLLAGDRMVRFGGKAVVTLKDFATLLRSKAIGDEVEIVVVREGQEQTLVATLGSKKREPDSRR